MSQPLEYSNWEDPAAARPPTRAQALWLCVPGALYLLIILALSVIPKWFDTGRQLVPFPYNLALFFLIFAVFAAAGAIAAFCIVRYGRPPYRGRPWYVWLTLAVNIGAAAGIVYGLFRGFAL